MPTAARRIPLEVPSADLPEIDEDRARQSVEALAEMLVSEFDFQRDDGSLAPRVNGSAAATPVDVEARLAAMAYQGAGNTSINETIKSIVPSLLWKGEHPDGVLERVVDAVLAAGAHAGQSWDRQAEVRRVGRSITSVYRLFLSQYDATSGEIPGWLPGEWHQRWIGHIASGVVPRIERTHRGFVFRTRCGTPIETPPRVSSMLGATVAEAPASPAQVPRVFCLRPFAKIDPQTLPPREWLYGRHYQRRTVSATIAPGGFGKTSLCMVEAVAMATARKLLGEQASARMRVWYHNGEDDDDELDRRLLAICQHFDIPQDELVGNLFVTSANSVPLRVAKGYNDLKIDAVLLSRIKGEIEANLIDVAILDPLVTLHGVSESDNSKMDTVVRLFAGISHDHDCAIELAHHTRKLSAGVSDYGGDDIRGASAIRDAVRAARMLNHMTPSDARDAAINDDERTSYFRVDKVKGNNAPPAKAVWRHFVGVELPNGDEVGVVEPWNFPGQGETTDAMRAAETTAEAVFLVLLVRFTLAGRVVNDKPGILCAPSIFSKEREAKDASVGKAALEQAMARLFEQRRIKVEKRHHDGRWKDLLAVV